MENYPEEIYVTREDDGEEDSFLVAHERLNTAADLDGEREVAIYKFVGVKIATVIIELKG